MAEPGRSYHHGALRDALVAEGRRLLLEQGPEAVTLRELARRTGVSHGAPQRHFLDREALLDAIAASGFDQLTDQLEATQGPGDFDQRFSTYAHTHVRFALTNGPLMELMFSKRRDPRQSDSPAGRAAARFFRLGAAMLGEPDPESLGTLPFLLAGTLEGISSLAATGRIPPDRLDEIVDAAVRMMLPTVHLQLQPAHKQAETTTTDHL